MRGLGTIMAAVVVVLCMAVTAVPVCGSDHTVVFDPNGRHSRFGPSTYDGLVMPDGKLTPEISVIPKPPGVEVSWAYEAMKFLATDDDLLRSPAFTEWPHMTNYTFVGYPPPNTYVHEPEPTYAQWPLSLTVHWPGYDGDSGSTFVGAEAPAQWEETCPDNEDPREFYPLTLPGHKLYLEGNGYAPPYTQTDPYHEMDGYIGVGEIQGIGYPRGIGEIYGADGFEYCFMPQLRFFVDDHDEEGVHTFKWESYMLDSQLVGIRSPARGNDFFVWWWTDEYGTFRVEPESAYLLTWNNAGVVDTITLSGVQRNELEYFDEPDTDLRAVKCWRYDKTEDNYTIPAGFMVWNVHQHTGLAILTPSDQMRLESAGLSEASAYNAITPYASVIVTLDSDNGMVTSIKQGIGLDGNATVVTEYTYGQDGQGHPTRTETSWIDGDFHQEVKYTFDGDERLLRKDASLCYNSTAAETISRIYAYDSDGRLTDVDVVRATKNGPEQLVSASNYAYAAGGGEGLTASFWLGEGSKGGFQVDNAVNISEWSSYPKPAGVDPNSLSAVIWEGYVTSAQTSTAYYKFSVDVDNAEASVVAHDDGYSQGAYPPQDQHIHGVQMEPDVRYPIRVKASGTTWDDSSIVLKWQRVDADGVAIDNDASPVPGSHLFLSEANYPISRTVSDADNNTISEDTYGYIPGAPQTMVSTASVRDPDGMPEESEYDYPDAFYALSVAARLAEMPGAPVKRVASVRVSDNDVMEVSQECYNVAQRLAARKDAGGYWTQYEYDPWGDPLYYYMSYDGVMSAETRDVSPTGLNLKTEYFRDSTTGAAVEVAKGIGGHVTDWWEIPSNASNVTTGYEVLRPEFVIRGQTYPTVIERRFYYHDEKAAPDRALLRITYSLPGGPVLCEESARVDEMSGGYPGRVLDEEDLLPGQTEWDDEFTILGRTDYVYEVDNDVSDLLREVRVFKGANIPSVDNAGSSSDYLATKYEYYDEDGDRRLHRMVSPTGEMTGYAYGYVTCKDSVDNSIVHVYREQRIHRETPNYQPVGPVNVTWTDVEGRVVRSFTTDINAQETYSNTEYCYDVRGRLEKTRVAYSIDTDGQCQYSDTVYTYDNLDRISTVTYPSGSTTYNFRKWQEVDNNWYWETRVYSWDSDYKSLAPVQVTWQDLDGRTVREWTGCYDDEYEPQGDEQLTELSRTTMAYDGAGRMTTKRVYTALGQSPAYVDTLYEYDERDVVTRTEQKDEQNATMALTKTTSDALGRPGEYRLGTTDNDAEIVAKSEYADVDNAAHLEPYVTRQTRLKPTDAVDNELQYMTTAYEYDAAGRLLSTKPDVGPWTHQEYDNAGRVTYVQTYSLDSDMLLAQTESRYDAVGRLSKTYVYEVMAGTAGVDSDGLMTSYDYDDKGRQCKVTQPSTAFTKTLYDRKGRVTGTYQCMEEGTNTDPKTLTDDKVVEQTKYLYDNPAGRWVVRMDFFRKHDDASTTGELTTANSVYRLSIQWMDPAGRVDGTADYGRDPNHLVCATNGTVTVPTNLPTPGGSADYIVALNEEYDNAGRLIKVTDNAGRVTRTYYDTLGRKIRVVENYVEGSGYWSGNPVMATTAPIAHEDKDVNRITQYAYDAFGNVTSQTLVDPNCDGNTGDNQVTHYTYSDGTSAYCAVPRKDLLVKVKYPEGDDNNDNVKLVYYPDGSLKKRTDQRGTALTSVYDDTGLLKAKKVDTGDEGTSTDLTVRSITYGYDEAQRLIKVSSHGNVTDDPDNTTDVKNQVANTYDGYSRLTLQKQEHGGASSGGSPDVQYAYDACSRLEAITYPNDRVIHHQYGYGSRVSRIWEGSQENRIADYSYNGSSRLVKKEHDLAEVYLDYTQNDYDGFDAFGRVKRQNWNGIMDTAYGYDASSNRTYADESVYAGSSQSYVYDELSRLTNFKAGKMNGSPTAPEVGTWKLREQDWTLTQAGDATAVKDFGHDDYYTATYNRENERTAASAKGVYSKPSRLYDDFSTSSSAGLYHNIGQEGCEYSTDAFDIDTTTGGKLTFTAVSADTFTVGTQFSESDEPRCVLIRGAEIGPNKLLASVTLSQHEIDNNYADYAGIVFGYQGPHEYWMLVLQKGNATTGGRYLYHVTYGARVMKAHTAFAVNAGASQWIMDFAKRNYDPVMNYDYGVEGYGGFPTGKVGLVSSRAGVTVDYFMVYDDAVNADVMGRWAANGAQTANASGYLDVGTSWLSQLNPILLKGVSIGSEGGWQATFSVRRPSSTNTYVLFAFNAKDQDHFNYLRIYHSSTQSAPYGYKFSDGHYYWVSGTRTNDNIETFTVDDTLWVRVISSSGTLIVKCIKKNDGPPDEGGEEGWSVKPACYVSDQFSGGGGTVGFLGDTGVRVSNFSLCYADPNGGPTITEDFSLTDGYASLSPTYDPAGNMTSDGLFDYTYDAWNRLTTVTRKCSSNAETNVAFAYDGLGRRIGKTVSHMGDRDCTYHFYYDDQRLIETRAFSDKVIKQYVWGTQYVDELLQIGVNTNPSSDNTCDVFYRVLQDANYNVTGLIDSEGDLVERYEYTPYGQRTVYKRASTSQTKPMCPVFDSQRVMTDNDTVTQPYGLCEFGHQGLYHDEEIGIIYNRARYVHPLFGIFMSWDPQGYVGGMNLYEDRETNPLMGLDPSGLDPYCGGPRTLEEFNLGRRLTEEEYAAKLREEKGLLSPEEELAIFAENLYILNGSPTPKSVAADVAYQGLVPLPIKTMIHQSRRGSAYYNFYRGRGCSGAGSLVRSWFWATGEPFLYTEVWEGVQGWEVDSKGEKHSIRNLDRAGRFCDAGGKAILIVVGIHELKGGGAEVAPRREPTQFDAHHIVQDAAVRDLPGYDTATAPKVYLEGPSVQPGTEHYLATQAQRLAGGGTLGAEYEIALRSLIRAGVPKATAEALVQKAQEYFGSIRGGEGTPTRIPRNRQ